LRQLDIYKQNIILHVVPKQVLGNIRQLHELCLGGGLGLVYSYYTAIELTIIST